MSAKRAFFSVFQKLVVFCCAIFFGFANAFSANLPSGYTELEYIESTGTQYIDTGVIPTSNTEIEMKILSNTNSGMPYNTAGSNSSSKGMYWLLGGTSNANMNGKVTSFPTSAHTLYTIIQNRNNVILNGNPISYGGVVTDFTGVNPLWIGGTATFAFSGRVYSWVVRESGSVVQHLIPCKNPSNVVGMYDTVSGTFFTNAGTGTFTAGPVVLDPCRNLFDENSVLNVHHTCAVAGTFPAAGTSENGRTYFMQVEPNTTYTVSMTTAGDRLYIFGINSVVNPDDYTSDSRLAFDRTIFGATTDIPRQKTFTTNANERMVAIYYALNTIPTYFQIEQGSTATAYVPYNASCHNTNSIKIATTAYNTARFSPVVNDLNSTVATIRDIVTNTINQTAAIASLQADKQTRPEDACPAGKKCLLVETEENGVIVPHWYPIIEDVD